MSARDFSITVAINAPPDRVWDVMSDFQRWPEWTPSVTSIEPLDTGPAAVGTRFRILQPKVPPAVWRLTALEPGRGFTWKSGSPAAWGIGQHWIEAAGQGSKATLSLQYGGLLGGIVARLISGLTVRYLNLEAQGLKRRSESLSTETSTHQPALPP